MIDITTTNGNTVTRATVLRATLAMTSAVTTTAATTGTTDPTITTAPITGIPKQTAFATLLTHMSTAPNKLEKLERAVARHV